MTAMAGVAVFGLTLALLWYLLVPTEFPEEHFQLHAGIEYGGKNKVTGLNVSLSKNINRRQEGDIDMRRQDDNVDINHRPGENAVTKNIIRRQEGDIVMRRQEEDINSRQDEYGNITLPLTRAMIPSGHYGSYQGDSRQQDTARLVASQHMRVLIDLGLRIIPTPVFLRPIRDEQGNIVFCPHDRFQFNHWCARCVSLVDGIIFSERRFRDPHGPAIDTNDVLLGHTQFELRDGICYNTTPRKVVRYTSDQNMAVLGQRCITRHDPSTGHIFWRDTVCEE